jgi:hypothetical protein
VSLRTGAGPRSPVGFSRHRVARGLRARLPRPARMIRPKGYNSSAVASGATALVASSLTRSFASSLSTSLWSGFCNSSAYIARVTPMRLQCDRQPRASVDLGKTPEINVNPISPQRQADGRRAGLKIRFVCRQLDHVCRHGVGPDTSDSSATQRRVRLRGWSCPAAP